MYWPDLEGLSETEKSDIAMKRTDALSKYVSASVEAIMPPLEFYVHILGFDRGEAQAIVKATRDHLAESHPDSEDPPMPGHVPAPPTPDPPPMPPVKMKDGDRLVRPEDGRPVR